MIKTKKELKFYLKADEIMNTQVFSGSLLKRVLIPSPIRSFLRSLRYLEYYANKREKSVYYTPIWLFYLIRYNKWKNRTGFDIPINSLGYGVRIAHLSTIVINGQAKIGNYCCFQNNIVIADANPKIIGDYCYIGSNVVIAKGVTLADGTTISSCSLVNKSFDTLDTLIGGTPSVYIKQRNRWTTEEPYGDCVRRIELLKKNMGL